ncbi:ATPase [Pseudomonas syringae pv. syringae]|uniref:ATPase n=1 Tax=Pseudomonas syringae TaxID=317 RepID=UPI00200A90E0|nr:ATPase [Pseudomonas syringae]MCK9712315.1 ATPase [Pseudomonas syringae pv. syringae]
MPGQIRINEAYCVELGRTVSITEARRAYFSLAAPRARFTFQCPDSGCLALDEPPTITGVNYASLPTDTYRAAHFRDPGVGHAPDCPWQADESTTDHTCATAAEIKDREAKRKLHDFINEFDPTALGKHVDTHQAPGADAGRSAQDRRGHEGVSKGESFTNRNRTKSFERLVEYYRNAAELDKEEFFSLQLKVAGEGEMSLISYFPNVSKARPGQAMRVIHGGARLEPRKGAGFMLWFIGKLDGKGVYLKVTNQEMEAYRFRGFFNDTLAQGTADYFRIFALGRVVLSETGKSYRLEVQDLNHLSLYAVTKKQPDQ